ncbi:MAG: restriction endonuclease subunit S [Planctomycetaceae bacterium]|nr:restriction endonuclease subunit S [Planctomycetales bacterium]MCB9924378.1 restriction endonuclease subunit S [Planctomycetaceae bacterium]
MSVRSKPNREGEATAEPERDGNVLPEGWTTATFRDLVDVLDSRRIPINSDERAKRLGDVPYFGATGQVGWIDDFLFDEEILLIGEDGAPFFDKSKPIAYIVRGKSWVNNHAHVLRANGDATSNLYLKYFLDWFDFNGFVNGTTRLKLTQAAMNSIPVRVAPLAEQRRIVGKLELLLGKVSSSQQRLSRSSGLLKRFRQSVLAAACSGKLTADWREENEAPPIGTPTEIDIPAEFPTLPESWSWATLESVCVNVVDCPHSTPKWADTGKLCIRTTNFRPGILDLTEVRFVSAETFNERIERLRPAPGDIVYSREGGILGLACQIPPGIELCLGQRIMLFRVGSEYAPTLLMHWLNPNVAKIVAMWRGLRIFATSVA